MNTDALRRLAIDRALGELSDDAAELLDAYIAEHPETSSIPSDSSETLSLVRSALIAPRNAGVDEPMPPLRMKTTRAQAATKPILAWSRRTAVAATILLAFLLGTRSGHQETEPRTPPQQVAAAPHEPTRDADVSGFWSLNRLLNSEGPRETPRGSQLKRTSPWMLPLHGEQS